MVDHSSGSQPSDYQYSSDLPRWIWRVAWVIFLAVLVAGMALAVALASGAADPPRAGPLVSQFDQPPTVTVLPGRSSASITAFDLPAPPYTVEVTSLIESTGAPGDLFPAWGIELSDSSFSVRLYRERYFSVLPALPDTTAFIHIRPAGESNTLYLGVDANSQGTLRINDEIAWQGPVPTANKLSVFIDGGKTGGTLIIQHAALYAPVR